MIFLKTADPAWSDMSEEERAALYREIQSFVKAGGVVTLTEWRQLSAVEKAVLITIRKGGVEGELATLEVLADVIEKHMAPKEPAKT